MKQFKSILSFIINIGLLIGICTSCAVFQQKNVSEYYNVIYTQTGKTIEYTDVTNLSKWDRKITFTTCDGKIITLEEEYVKIIPIDVD